MVELPNSLTEPDWKGDACSSSHRLHKPMQSWDIRPITQPKPQQMKMNLRREEGTAGGGLGMRFASAQVSVKPPPTPKSSLLPLFPQIIRKRSKIIRAYVSSWLVLDVISSIPFDWFLGDDPSDARLVKTTKLSRLVKILRILRLIKLMKVVRVRGFMWCLGTLPG